MENREKYQTKNLFVASFLQATGNVQFLGLKDLDGKTKLFVFSPADLASQYESDYFSGAAVPAKTLFAEYNTLKDLLFSEKTTEKNYGG